MVEVDSLEVVVEADYDLVKTVVVRLVATRIVIVRIVIVRIAVVKISADEARFVRK